MKKLMTRSGLLVAGLLLCMNAYSLTLAEAKAQGLVGEQPNGMLGIVASPTAEVSALVRVINEKRKAAYRDIAERNGTDLGSVQNLAGQKAMNKTPVGHYIKVNGQWQQVR